MVSGGRGTLTTEAARRINMKTRGIVLCVIGGLIVAAVILFGFAEFAGAQETHPDIDLARQGSTYTLVCQPVEPIDKMVSMCAIRTFVSTLEMEPRELGCVPHSTLDPISIEVTVERTPHQDGMLRCYAIDSEGNVSDISMNAGVADFTPNGRPRVK
jgi:hypothetical protein